MRLKCSYVNSSGDYLFRMSSVTFSQIPLFFRTFANLVELKKSTRREEEGKCALLFIYSFPMLVLDFGVSLEQTYKFSVEKKNRQSF